MSNKEQKRRPRRRRRSSGSGGDNNNQNKAPAQVIRFQRPEEPIVPYEMPQLECALCQKTIDDASSAIAFGPEGHPAHFECVQERLQNQEELSSEEKLVYVGNGQFGVVEQNRQGSFTVKRRIPVEPKDDMPEWRRSIKSQLAR